MPDKLISNPAGLWGMTADANPDVKTYVNNSATTVAPGDVVCFTTDTTGVLITTTTTLNDKTVIGVVAAKSPSDSLTTQSGVTYAIGAQTPVVIRGPARINIAANTVAAGDLLTTSTVAKVAVLNAGAPAANAVSGSIIAVALESQAAKDANNTIRAYIGKT